MKREVMRFYEVSIRNEYQEQLTGLNLVFREGESCLICSRDYTGRSLTNIFCGNNHILKGKFFLNGVMQEECNGDVFKQHRIYYMDNQVKFMECLNLAENIFLLRKNSLNKVRLNEKAILLRVRELFVRFGLDLQPEQQITSLRNIDKVLMQLVCLANQNPKMLVLNNLSFICNREDLKRLLAVLGKIKETGIALAIYDSNPVPFLELSDKILFMKRGAVLKKLFCQDDFGRYWTKLAGQEAERLSQEKDRKTRRNARGFFRFTWKAQTGSNCTFEIFPGEVLGLPSDDWEHQLEICRGILGLGAGGAVMEIDGHKIAYKTPDVLRKERIVFWGSKRIEDELFPNLSIQDNILLPSVKRISRFGFYRLGEKFIFQNQDFLNGLEGISNGENLSEEELFRILCYRWKLYHPKVLITYNVLSRFDSEMKRWISGQFLEMAERGTSLLLLEMEEEIVGNIADRVIKLGR